MVKIYELTIRVYGPEYDPVNGGPACHEVVIPVRAETADLARERLATAIRWAGDERTPDYYQHDAPEHVTYESEHAAYRATQTCWRCGGNGVVDGDYVNGINFPPEQGPCPACVEWRPKTTVRR